MLFNLSPFGMAESEPPQMYFGDKLLWKAGLLGDYQTNFLPLPPKLKYVNVDAANEKIYYMERYGRFLWKMDFDGRNVEEVKVREGPVSPYILVDTVEGKFYWCGWSSIVRLDVGAEYSEREILIDTDFHTAYIFLDEVSRRLYWLEEEENDEFETIYTLRSANLDGGDIKDQVTGMKIGDVGEWFGIGIDNVKKHVYWLDSNLDDWDDYTKIRRANFEDAGGVVDVSEDGGEIFIDLGDAWAQKFLVDEANRMLYWFADDYSYKVDEYVTFLYSANFDDETPVPEKVVETRSFWINYMTLSDGKVYWTDSDETPAGSDIDSVWTVSVDGIEEPENLTFIDFPSGIAVDTESEKLYWAVPNLGIIRSANLDGTDMVDLITGLNHPEDVALDPIEEKKIYWTEGPRQDDVSGEDIDVWSIRRADIDSTNKEVFYYHEFNDEAFRGLAIDAKRRMVYWISRKGIEAMKTDEGGYFPSAIEYSERLIYDSVMVEGYEELFDLAIDSVNSQLYWITGQLAFAHLWEYKLGAIKRSNLDGSRVRPVVSGLINPRGIAIDPINEKIYWTAEEEGGRIGKVQWANFDGTDVDDVIEETYPGVKDIALGLKEARPISIYPTGDVSGDFKVDAYDAALILQFSIGMIDKFPIDELIGMSPENAVPCHYELSVPELKAFGGECIYVPIAINGVKGFLAGGITLKYDATVLIAKKAYPGLNGTYWRTKTDIDGEVRMAFVSLEEATESDTLFVVEFDVLSDAEGKESPIILDYVELSNSLSIHKTDGMLTVLPRKSRLFQNYPNPFNPETWIPYQLSLDSDVTISIYNARGEIVHQLNFGAQPAGSYLTKDKAVYWNGRNREGESVSSGIYLYVLKAGDFLATRKMVIVK